MPSIANPQYRPDPSLTRAAMETGQEQLAAEARFEDAVEFSAASTAIPTPLEAATQSTEDQPLVAGVDQSFLLDREPHRALSAIVVMRGNDVVERVHAVTPLEIPYIPGLLAFREGGPIVEAMQRLECEPDLYLFDGSGRIHFRQAGIATHMGVLFDVPAIGVAKSLLCGEPVGETSGLETGETVAIQAGSGDRVNAPPETTLGYAVQTKQYHSSSRYVNPVYVSPGHRISAETAADLVLGLTAGYKLPEPIRLADGYATEAKAEFGTE